MSAPAPDTRKPKRETRSRLTISVRHEPDREAELRAVMLLLGIPAAEREELLDMRREEMRAAGAA